MQVNTIFEDYYSIGTWILLTVFFAISIVASLVISTCVLFGCSVYKFREFLNIKDEFRWEER